jgi:hypothetical protein
MHALTPSTLVPAGLALAQLGSVLWDFIRNSHTFLLMVGLLVFFIAAWQRRRNQPAYVHLANQLGFNFQEGQTKLNLTVTDPTLDGRHRGRTIQLGPQADPFYLKQSPWKKRRLFSVTAKFSRDTDFQLYMLPNLAESRNRFKELEASRIEELEETPNDDTASKQMLPKVAEARKRLKQLEESPTGEAEFDQIFLVCSNNPAKAKSLLTSKIRKELLAANQLARPQFSQRVLEAGARIGRLRLREIFSSPFSQPALEDSASFDRQGRPNILGPCLAIENGEVSYVLRKPLNSRFKLQDRFDHYVEKMDFVCNLAERIEGQT